jgi:quaternary ammonium compound-resistance protein SugE
MSWLFLLLAGLLEVVWALSLKSTEGFTRLWPTVFTLAIMAASFILLAQAVRTLPISTAYAVWTGIGAVGAAIFGVLIFREAVTVAKVICIALIVAGVVGLRLVEGRP